jgi:Ribonuclease G/E
MTVRFMAAHWAVREPALRNHGGIIPILFILFILSKKRSVE